MVKGIVSAEGVQLPENLFVKFAEWQSQHFSQLETPGTELRKKMLLDRLLTYELYVQETRARAAARNAKSVTMDPMEAFNPELDGESLDSDDEAYIRQVRSDFGRVRFGHARPVEGLLPQSLVDTFDWVKLSALMRLGELIAPQWPHHHQLNANSPEECLFALQRSMPLDTHYRAAASADVSTHDEMRQNPKTTDLTSEQ
eukprot:g29735.t1